MNKEYPGSSIEFKAKELLASIQGNCPDMVWNEVNIELEAKRTKANEKWFNKYNTPRVALIATACIAIITLTSWKLIFSNKSSVGPDKSYYQSQDAQSAGQIVNNTPPVTKTSAVTVTRPKKDSTIAVVTTQPVANGNIPTTQPVQLALNNTANKANVIQKPVIQHNGPMPSQSDSTHGSTVKAGAASLPSVQPDTSFTFHRVGAPISSGGAAMQDTASN